MDRLTNIRVQVHGVHKVHIRIFLTEILHGRHHANETFSKVLSSMTGNQDQLLAAVQACHIVACILQYIDLLVSQRLVCL